MRRTRDRPPVHFPRERSGWQGRGPTPSRAGPHVGAPVTGGASIRSSRLACPDRGRGRLVRWVRVGERGDTLRAALVMLSGRSSNMGRISIRSAVGEIPTRGGSCPPAGLVRLPERPQGRARSGDGPPLWCLFRRRRGRHAAYVMRTTSPPTAPLGTNQLHLIMGGAESAGVLQGALVRTRPLTRAMPDAGNGRRTSDRRAMRGGWVPG